MDFYTRQAEARSQSRWLVIMFIVALVCVVATLDLVLFTLLGASEDNRLTISPLQFAALNPRTAVVCTLIVAGVLVLSSLFKSLQLRSGGGVVARSVGGVRLERDTTDLKRKRLHNVIEEMAIASGVPMPEVYVLEQEEGINAFSAGHTPANAAIAVTQGALDRLNREQLQGLIAHEFSHILNGDMRINVQLMGWLFGLLVIGIIGRTVLRVSPRSRKGGNGIVLVALAVMVLGYVGLFFGRLIQAAVSRQRERLADASAVQFTRNPPGLKGVLLKVAGLGEHGSRLEHADAEQVAHMLFAPGLRRMFATHPSIPERLKALDPSFRPEDLPRLAAEAIAQSPPADEPAPANDVPRSAPGLPGSFPLGVSAVLAGAAAGTVGEVAGDAAIAAAAASASAARAAHAEPQAVTAAAVSSQVGNLETVQIEHAASLRLALPTAVREFADSSGRARALVLAMLLSRDAAVREKQFERLARDLDAAVLDAIRAATPIVDELQPMLRLPALLQLFPAIRRLPEGERRAMIQRVDDLIRADARIDVFEFCLAQLIETLMTDELEARAPHGNVALSDAQQAIHVLFATLARLGSQGDREGRMAYEAGMHLVFPLHRPPYAVYEDWPRRLGTLLPQLDRLHPFAKKTLIEGLVKTIGHDNTLTIDEAELLRTVCGVLHCPLPPLLPQAGA